MQPVSRPRIRRRMNGTIDIDHYRLRALSMRREASIEMLRGARSIVAGLAAGAALLIAFALVMPHTTTRNPELQAAAPQSADAR